MDDLRERLEAALQLVHDLAQGKRSWTLSVPARPDYDPDLVLSSVLRETLDHPERLLGELVAEITYSNWNGMNVEMTHHAAGKFPVGTKLYVKKVKP